MGESAPAEGPWPRLAVSAERSELLLGGALPIEERPTFGGNQWRARRRLYFRLSYPSRLWLGPEIVDARNFSVAYVEAICVIFVPYGPCRACGAGLD